MKLNQGTIQKYAEEIEEVLKERDNGFGLRASQIAEDCDLNSTLIGHICRLSPRFVDVGNRSCGKYLRREKAREIGVID